MRYTLSTLNEETGTTVGISGELTIYAVSELLNDFMDIYTNAKQIQLDLSEITAIDTAGAQFLIFLKKIYSGENSIKLIRHSKPVLKIFDLYGLTGFFGDPLSIKSSQRNEFSFKYGLKKHPERMNVSVSAQSAEVKDV